MGVFSSLRRRFVRASPRQGDAAASRPSSPLLHPTSSIDPSTGLEDHSQPATEEPVQSAQVGPIPSTNESGGSTEKQSKRPSCLCFLPPTGQRGRNLVVCIDGTANQFSEKNTNVVELYSRLDKDAEQLTYYDSGIGTYVKDSTWSPSYWKQVASNAIDMAIAWNFKKIVLGAYEWLSENYQEGDKIFLFGFSRGAYQVRVIAGMIEKVGLLHKGNNNQIPFAYELYKSTTANQKRSDANSVRPKRAKKRNHVRVHFVGTWDTVSSIGFARGPSLPETTTGMTHVCVYRHALALDERRGKFQPEYANGGEGPPIGGEARGDVKEVWFVGSHSDIGGGNVRNLELDHFGAALRWMSYEAITHGLRMSPRRGEWQTFAPNISVHWFYKILDCIPYRRLSYKDRDSTTRRPHLGAARQVKHGQLVHESVFESIKTGKYTPLASLPDGAAWDGEIFWSLERDPYNSAVVMVSQLEADTKEGKSLSSAQRDVLTTLTSTKPGCVSLATAPDAGDTLFRALVLEHSQDNPNPRPENIALLATAITAVGSQPHASMDYSGPRPRELVSVLAHLPGTAKVYKDFIEMFRQIRLCRGHNDKVYSAVFSPDGKRVVSGSGDKTIRTWDAQTGETVGLPFTGHTGFVITVAFSPDGTRIVSGSGDRTLRNWDAHTGEAVAGPFTGHSYGIMSAVFSPDGTHIVSGSGDRTVRIWDAQTGETVVGPYIVAVSHDGTRAGSADGVVGIWNSQTGETVAGPFTGHTGWVYSAAFSPDGARVVSGAGDDTIRLWDAQTGEMVVAPFTGHTHMVMSVAFSPDGTRIVSGSVDKTIRIWDAQTGETVAGPFIGHTDMVMCVEFSPDGTHIVSCSNDKTIRIWDAQTGETVVGPLTGHTNRIWSVSYSPDGKLVVSSSSDQTIRIWDAEVDDGPGQ
ncbi:WD40 repeat-like protein [Auriscalpium vulgare]|uniref:WD40 repeat-like protein n=1 Tax=Auriscalpium vulgare TaxID=40419 RepID=A0ACB8RDZ3_9AGAM|nr:WD40 repeat-like protein [Auriscalpium vulgare]